MRVRSPLSSIAPSSGWYTPARIFIRVDLPAPFSPTMACTSPARTSSSTSLSARIPGNDLPMPRMRSTGEVAVVVIVSLRSIR